MTNMRHLEIYEAENINVIEGREEKQGEKQAKSVEETRFKMRKLES